MSHELRDVVPRIVLDTNVCLDLFLFNDPACVPLAGALASGLVRPVVDAACRDEWLRVLEYPSVPIRPEQRDGLRGRFDAVMELLSNLPDPAALGLLPVCRDPDDQKFLELALASGAQWLLSKDRHLLKLARRTRRAGQFLILRPDQWSAALVGRMLLRETG